MQERFLNELGSVNRGKSRHRPRDAEFLYGGPYPFIQTADVKHSQLYITSYSQTYSEKGLAQSKLWPTGTLCITIAANIADTAILSFPACFPDSVIGFIPDPEKADVNYIKYLFDAFLKKRYMKFTQGVAQDNLSQGKLLSIKFPVPNLTIQKKAASILSTYDDLIENNRRRIELLEESARLLYQEWFVRLRFPGYENTRIINGVPEGWKIVKLADLSLINKSNVSNGFKGCIEYIDISSVVCGSITSSTSMDYSEAPSRAKRKIEHGDIIWSCVRPNRKSFAIIWNPSNKTIVSTGFAVISPSDLELSPFLYFSLTTQNYVDYLEKVATGVAYPAVKPCDFENSLILFPTKKLISQFSEIAVPVFEITHNLRTQNQKLAEARDLLLPRLMSGEIEV